MPAAVHAFVTMRSAGISVVLDLRNSKLPALLHWGSDLGELNAADVTALAHTAEAPVTPNMVDIPIRVALLPEVHGGWTGRPGVSGSRGGAHWSPSFTTTAIRVAGDTRAADGVEPTLISLGAGVVEVDATDPVAELDLLIRIEVTEAGLLRCQAQLTNTSVEPYTLDDLVIAYPIPAHARELLDFAGRWSLERTPQRGHLSVGTHLREGRRGRTGADGALVLHAGAPGFGFATGDVWGLHTAWSGNHTHYAERLANGDQVIGGGELLLPGEMILAQGESYSSPWVYGSFGVGLDEVARRFHRQLRARPTHPNTERPVTINVWEAVYFDHSLPPLLDLAEIAAGLGVERFVLDDGWFGSRRDDHSGLGDWTVSPDVWPDGLHPLTTKVTELGMQFGLWFEPEMVNLDSDVARAHPDWVMSTGGRTPVPSRHQHVLNLGISECYAYVRDSMLALLDEYPIGYIKWDHNRDLTDAGSPPDGRPGVHTQTLATYRMMDELKAAHPGLEIESCSSGGARIDLAIMDHTDRVWVSDCNDPHERQAMMRWTQQLLPPELLGAHVASPHSHTTGRRHDLDFRAASALFGHLGIEWNLREASPEDLSELKEWIDFYREHRDLLLRGDLVRIDSEDPGLNAFGVVSPDRNRAIFSVATVERSDVASRGRIRMPGLDPQRRYWVRPALLGTNPSGLRPPAWWRVKRTDNGWEPNPKLAPIDERTGVEVPGSVLAASGLMDAPVNPDHAVIYLVDAVD